MNFIRRRFLHLASAAVALPAVSRIATAQSYPTRPVRVIVPFAPAGTTDVMARLLCQRLSERLGQPFVVENRPGAGTNIATEAVVRAPADGYTLLVVPPPSAINATLYQHLNFNVMRDIAPVAGVMRTPYAMEVHLSVPAKTVPEFIAYAKANPGKISFASAGVGTSPQLISEMFMMMAGVKMVHVPYRGGAPALNDLLAGQVQLYFASIPETLAYITAGQLRALAVTTATRSKMLPDTPVLSDFLPGLEASYWAGIGAPRNTPTEIVDKLNTEINAVLADPELQTRFSDLGASAIAGSPAAFGKLIADETEKWGKIIKVVGIKQE
jgi:tripartite-type tricarboxylate transporter receptor subunit TctC